MNNTSFLDRVFHLKENGTTIKTEILAGATTFMTMALFMPSCYCLYCSSWAT